MSRTVEQDSWHEVSSPRWNPDRARLAAGVGAALATVVVLVPPVVTSEGHLGYLEAVQFGVLALVVPPLVVLAAPFRRSAAAARLADSRRRRLGFSRAVPFLLVELAVLVAWRIPPSVDAIAGNRLFLILEIFSLVPAGVALWLECLPSPPLEPRLAAGPSRVALCALTMWTVWILAYVVGLSHGSWYPAYSAPDRRGIGVATDQQITTGLLWFIAGVVFVPVIFYELVHWLQNEEQPDVEMHRLLREERRLGPPSKPPGEDAPPG
ncbi:MAG: hypothetical protein JWM85_2631 [Acidimicrobiaceae bacterium]|nr:hypothetical protein [Acidimicrobiaceae bacterium]